MSSGISHNRDKFGEHLGENIFALATDFFFKAGPQGWVGWEAVSSAQVFWNVFFCVEKGVNEEKTETRRVRRQTVGKGGGRP